MQSLIALCQSLGYQLCASAEREQDFNKVCIYAKGAEYAHAARQLADGGWTSKLGQSVQIEYATLEALTEEAYGVVAQILKRPLPPGNVVP